MVVILSRIVFPGETVCDSHVTVLDLATLGDVTQIR